MSMPHTLDVEALRMKAEQLVDAYDQMNALLPMLNPVEGPMEVGVLFARLWLEDHPAPKGSVYARPECPFKYCDQELPGMCEKEGHCIHRPVSGH